MTITIQNPVEVTGARPFVLSHTFHATRVQIWKAWTEREHLMQWFGPKGFKMPAAKMDFHLGGSFHYCLEGPDGSEMWGKFTYREITAPERIVLVTHFSNEEGEVTRHPFSATWPLKILSIFKFHEEDEQTTVTVQCFPIDSKPEERETFDSAHNGMRLGWAGTFDQLIEYLTANRSF